MTDKGTGKSLYSGKVALRVRKSGRKFTLVDSTRGGQATYTKGGRTSNTRGTLVASSTRTFGNYKTSSRSSAAADAHFGAAKTWDFYKSTFGRNGIRNDGVGAYSRVHYGKRYQNAYWDNSCFCMTYGDGAAQVRPLVALDVAGHEMTHGVTSQTDGLDYFGDAGGLSESSSDVMGTMVEFYANVRKDPGDYYLGEKIVKVRPGWLRRMDNPAADGRSVNCWSTSTKNLDPHYSSGVGNHLFYLLAEGTGAKKIGGRAHSSTSCTGTTFPGIGRSAAAAIWYRAMTVYWLSSETYPQAANGMVKAARDLYGAGSAVCLRTATAWAAVKAAPTVSCSAPTTGDPAGNAVSNPGFESGAAWWTQSPSGLISTTRTAYEGPRSGSHFAWLNGFGVANTQMLTSGAVSIPSAGSATLKLFTKINTNEDPSSNAAHDFLRVQVVQGGGTSTTTVAMYSNLDLTYGPYDLKAIDLSPYAGETVALTFIGTENSTRATEFLLDDMRLYTAG